MSVGKYQLMWKHSLLLQNAKNPISLEKSAENSRRMKIPFFEKEKEVLYNDRKFIIRSDYFERSKKVFHCVFIDPSQLLDMDYLLPTENLSQETPGSSQPGKIYYVYVPSLIQKKNKEVNILTINQEKASFYGRVVDPTD